MAIMQSLQRIDLVNPRQERFCQEIASGKTEEEAYSEAGYKNNRSHASRLVSKGNIRARIAELQHEIFAATLVDAQKLHKRWSDMFEADFADIIDEETGHYKPVHKWPKIWRQMLTGCDRKKLYGRSKDGKEASWDEIGEIVRLRFISHKDLGELLARHRSVNAFVPEQTGDMTLNLTVNQINAAKLMTREELLELRERLQNRAAGELTTGRGIPSVARNS